MSIATFTKAGRTACAQAVAATTLHLAWGKGAEDWDEEESTAHRVTLSGETALTAEVGRRLIPSTQFVIADDEGEIVIPSGFNGDEMTVYRYSVSETPTSHIYIRAVFDFTDAAGETIRELALFSGGVTDPSLPPGQRYFLPSQVTEPGTLMAVQRLNPPLARSQTMRQSFEFVLNV